SKMLGAKRVMVVVSEDGFDEISPCAPTYVIEIDEKNQKKEYTINPSDYGIPTCASSDLDGGTGKENVALAMDLIQGKGRPGILYSCALNAGATLYIGGKVKSIKEGFDRALKALQDGSVMKKIEEVRKATHE
ncbi:MAG TPA: bifunctional anthranilate synthase component II/anthranilate phosphoribosyltransferase, partial [Fibrobacteraceae bacterium]|nr:bifunctional anthranilate synthase component II/anthranilate phosphoribosyltransferase [Fibrobacteraceae bacterium]